MPLATLIFAGRAWLAPAAGLVVATALFVVWGYRRAAATVPVRLASAALKLLGVLALAACLLDPQWSGQRATPGSNQFLIVADNSQSLQVHDDGHSESRGDVLRNLLSGGQNNWQTKLEEFFQVRRYWFGARLEATRDFGEMNFDGRASSIGAALRALKDRFEGRPVAGILLLTDGNATDLPGGTLDLPGLPPVYPVIMGNDEAVRDVALNNVRVSQSAFEDAPVSVQGDVSATGFAGSKVTAQIIDRAGKTVAEQTLTAPAEGEGLAYRFQLRPETNGVSFYRLQVAPAREIGRATNEVVLSEATLANNRRLLTVDRGQGPHRILYVAGRPNWEYKFLHRAIDEDDQLQLVALIRIAKRERKFAFRGREGESSNPLFRGFGNQSAEEIERYDQPVLRRLNTRDETELSGGFPKTAEELYQYEAVVIGDLEAEFFTADQALLLQRFVSERGGGLLMLGGQESLHEGNYQRTPIGDMLPVYLDQAPSTNSPPTVRLTLTREGWLQPWARLRNNEQDERSRLEDMPPFLVLNQVRDVKPGASVIATVADAAGKNYPALVVQRFGRGRTAAMMIGDLWHWGFRDEAVHRDLDKSWRQTMRWLVADVPNRVDVLAEAKPGDPNQTMRLQVRVRDPKFQPLDNVSVSLQVHPVTEGLTNLPAIRLRAEPALNEAGLYQAEFVPRQTGGYLVEATVTNSVGAEVGHAQAGWTTDLAGDEFRSLKPNRALLEALAKKSGGEVVSIGGLNRFIESLPTRKAPVMQPWSYPLWHQPAVFLFALACFVAEWGLRRWKGMP